MIARCIALGLPMAGGPDPDDLRGRTEPHPAVGPPHAVPARQPRRAADRPRRLRQPGRPRSPPRGPRGRTIAVRVPRSRPIRAQALTVGRGDGPALGGGDPRSVAVLGTARTGRGFDSSSRLTCSRSSRSRSLRGTGPAVATAIGVVPRLRLPVHRAALHAPRSEDPGEWLNLILLLVVGDRGRSAGRRASANGRSRRERASARRAALFNISFTPAPRRATRTRCSARSPRSATRRDVRVWVEIGEGRGASRRRHGTDGTGSRARRSSRDPAPAAGRRARRVGPGAHGARTRRPEPAARATGPRRGAYRVAIVAGGETLGAIWAVRPRELGRAGPGETRVLAAAADQIGGRSSGTGCGARRPAAEIARQSDALKSALLQSVSHDLRTPLASDPGGRRDAHGSRGRLAGGTSPRDRGRDRPRGRVAQPARHQPARHEPGRGRRAAAEPAVFALADLVGQAVARTDVASAGRRSVTVDVPDRTSRRSLVDEVFLDQVLTNTLDNAVKYAGPGAPIRVAAARGGHGLRPPDGRGRRPGRAAGGPAAAVREVLPGAAQGRGLAARHRDRAGRRPRARRGDGRQVEGDDAASSAASRSTSTCRSRSPPSGRPGRRCEPASHAAAARSCSSRTTSRPARRSPRSSRGHGHEVDEAGDAPRRPRPGSGAGPTSSCSTSACPTWTASSSSAGSGARRRRRS